MAKKPAAQKSVEALKHDEAKRKNVPTAEFQSVLETEQQNPKKVRYPRNTDLDPQLVWRGTDEQDWSDLVVHAPRLYIQEKVHPKVLIDDLLRTAKEHEQNEGTLTPEQRNSTPTGGRPASAGRKKLTQASPPRPNSNTSTTSPTTTKR